MRDRLIDHCISWYDSHISDGNLPQKTCVYYQFIPYIHMNTTGVHDDVIKWKHLPRYWPFVRGIHRSPVNSPHKGQWRGALMFSLICAWINGWVNNPKADDLRRRRAHYDVTVMCSMKSSLLVEDQMSLPISHPMVAWWHQDKELGHQQACFWPIRCIVCYRSMSLALDDPLLLVSNIMAGQLDSLIEVFNSLWPGGATWCVSTLAQVMVCCLFSEVVWHPPESNFTTSAQAAILCNEFENDALRITTHFTCTSELKLFVCCIHKCIRRRNIRE